MDIDRAMEILEPNDYPSLSIVRHIRNQHEAEPPNQSSCRLALYSLRCGEDVTLSGHAERLAILISRPDEDYEHRKNAYRFLVRSDRKPFLQAPKEPAA